jgi:hypothetical protein
VQHFCGVWVAAGREQHFEPWVVVDVFGDVAAAFAQRMLKEVVSAGELPALAVIEGFDPVGSSVSRAVAFVRLAVVVALAACRCRVAAPRFVAQACRHQPRIRGGGGTVTTVVVTDAG